MIARPRPYPTRTRSFGPRPVYAEHRADFLTMVLADGSPELADFSRPYPTRSNAERAAIRAAHVAAGMTRYGLNTCQDDADHLENPDHLVPFLHELHAEGLGPILLVGLEDAPRMQAKYHSMAALVPRVVEAFKRWAPFTAEVWLGVEVNEYWTEAEVCTVARAVRAGGFTGPIAVHYGSGQLGGDWSAKVEAGVTHFAFQSTHPAVEDFGRGFLADPNAIKAELARVVAHVKGKVHVIASEYAYFGKHPSPEAVAAIAARGRTLGGKALEVAGIVGISNGGPGYWPPEEARPIDRGAAVDEVDLATVKFFTRAGKDITARIAAWPIDSILTGKIAGSHIDYDHSAARSWPTEPGSDISGASWIGFSEGGGWRMYTNDYLRRGSSSKEWPKLAALNGEPIHRTAQRGETILMMASRTDPRLDKYPNGAGRTQIIKVVVP